MRKVLHLCLHHKQMMFDILASICYGDILHMHLLKNMSAKVIRVPSIPDVGRCSDHGDCWSFQYKFCPIVFISQGNGGGCFLAFTVSELRIILMVALVKIRP